MTRQFKQRLLISSLSILVLMISIYYSYTSLFKPIFILLTIVVNSLALIEYFHLAHYKGFQPSNVFGVGITAIYTIALVLSLHSATWNDFPTLILLISFVLLFLSFFKRPVFPLGNLAVTVFGIIYLTLPISCVLRINYFFSEYALEDGRLWLAYVLIVTKMTDIGAYFCGKTLGKNKLALLISPKKTIEGAIGGLVTAVLASVIFVIFATKLAIFHMTFLQSIWIGILMSILAQLGDLSESLLKRDAGVKDSSHLPGLGGMLDVVDSLVFTLPLMYLLLKMQIVG